jgi:hypothetical protein
MTFTRLFCCCSSGVWTQGLALAARQVLYHLSHIHRPFWCSYFSNRSLCLWKSGPGPPFSYLRFLCSWNDRHEIPTPSFYWLRWGLANSCPGWSGTVIFPQISASWVARITSMSHCAWLRFFTLISHLFLNLWENNYQITYSKAVCMCSDSTFLKRQDDLALWEQKDLG